MQDVIEKLLASNEPAVRYKVRVKVLGEDPQSGAIKKLQRQIKSCKRIKRLLSQRSADGRIPYRSYAKWHGAHWVLAVLADLGYPPGDRSLIPLREQVYDAWLSEGHIKRVRIIDGRARRCGSQEGNALYSLLTLGLADKRADRLVHNLIKWQWLDGGWNCDKRPEAVNSSFHETLLPLRALALYGKVRDCKEATEAARRAAKVFLKRKMFRRQADGSIIDRHFLELHYPCYWYYDLLTGLKVMADAGFIGDRRCREAIEVLKSKRLDDGGFPAEAKYYHTADRRSATGRRIAGYSPVDWGGVSKRNMNEFVTADALYVLAEAERVGT
ncbi:MAG: prenyltransferase/squalene oxidase repeat-containing protein [Planctomycetota bacterium]|jgi:hypothetical protein